MTEAEVYDRIVAFLVKVNADAALITPGRDILGRIIRANPNAPRPTGDYAALNLLSLIDVGEADCDLYREVTIAATPRAVHDKVRAVEWLFRLEVYATYATDAARLFGIAFRSDYSNVLLAPLTVRRVDDVTRAPELIQQRWEGRANLDFAIGGIVVESTLTEFIESGGVEFDDTAAAFSASLDYQKD